MRRRRQPVECGVDRRKGLRRAHRVPDGRELVELPAHRPAEQPPESWPTNDDVGDDAGETLAKRHGRSRCKRTPCPGCAANISAALPRLIAIATLRYESSYRTISPGRA